MIVDDHVCAARNDVPDSICINGGNILIDRLGFPVQFLIHSNTKQGSKLQKYQAYPWDKSVKYLLILRDFDLSPALSHTVSTKKLLVSPKFCSFYDPIIVKSL